MRSVRQVFTPIIILFGVLMLIVFSLPACSKKNEESKEIRIGYIPYSSSLSFFVADEQGFFKEKHLNVKAIKCASTNEAVNALLAGQLDFVMGVGLSTFFAVEGASPNSFKCFQPCVEDSNHTVSYLLVPKESPLNDISELKGKHVGTYSGTSQVLVLRLLLQKLGLNPDDSKDVRIGDVSSNFQVDALAAGQFDAFLMLEPYATKAMLLHGAKPLKVNPRVEYILNPFPAGANAVSTQFYATHPQETRMVIDILNRAITIIHQDEIAAKTILPKYDSTITPSIAGKTGIYRWWTTTETDFPAIQKYADMLFEGKVLNKPIDVSSMFLKNP